MKFEFLSFPVLDQPLRYIDDGVQIAWMYCIFYYHDCALKWHC